MATHYLEEIRRVHPQGPYSLGGYCFGGIVAFEIAQRLAQENQSPTLLVLVDPDDFADSENSATGISASNSTAKGVYVDRIRRYLNTIVSLEPRKMLRYCLLGLTSKIAKRTVIRKSVSLTKTAIYKTCFALRIPLPAAFHSHYMLQVYESAFRRYVPRPYTGRLIVWKSKQSAYDRRMWQKISRNVEINLVTSKHAQLLEEPHARVWADSLAHELRRSGLGSLVVALATALSKTGLFLAAACCEFTRLLESAVF
jgi:thioesterase domain-containing protein